MTTDKNLVKEEKKKSQTSALQILGIICYCFLFINFSENSSKHRILKLLNDKDLKTQNKKIYQIYDLSSILQDTRAFGNEGQRPMINYILDFTLGVFYIEWHIII